MPPAMLPARPALAPPASQPQLAAAPRACQDQHCLALQTLRARSAPATAKALGLPVEDGRQPAASANSRSPVPRADTCWHPYWGWRRWPARWAAAAERPARAGPGCEVCRAPMRPTPPEAESGTAEAVLQSLRSLDARRAAAPKRVASAALCCRGRCAQRRWQGQSLPTPPRRRRAAATPATPPSAWAAAPRGRAPRRSAGARRRAQSGGAAAASPASRRPAAAGRGCVAARPVRRSETRPLSAAVPLRTGRGVRGNSSKSASRWAAAHLRAVWPARTRSAEPPRPRRPPMPQSPHGAGCRRRRRGAAWASRPRVSAAWVWHSALGLESVAAQGARPPDARAPPPSNAAGLRTPPAASGWCTVLARKCSRPSP